MKAKLREKYMPPNYEYKLCEQLVNLKQGAMTVAENMQKFDQLKTWRRTIEDPRQSLARFKSGLRFEIRKEMPRYAPNSVENAFEIALDLEEYLNMSTLKKSNIQQKDASRKFSSKTPAIKPSYTNKTQEGGKREEYW